MNYRRVFFLLVAVLAVSMGPRPHSASAGDEWLPISPEELKMTSVPEAPGAPAIYLYRQVDRDDSERTPHEYNYARIKILTEGGEKTRTWRFLSLRRTKTYTASGQERSGRTERSRILKEKLLTRPS